MGSKPSSQQSTSSSYSPPPAVLAQYQKVTGQAQDVAATPYQAYGGPLVSPVNGQQTSGINAINDTSGIQNGYNAGATGLAAGSAQNIDPTQFSGQALGQFENPYQSDVVNTTEAELNQQNAQQQQSLQSNAIASGAFGGDRAGIASAALAGQQDIANNATIAGLNASNFQNAESEFNTQQGTNLSAEQNNAARELAASQQLGALGNTAQTEGLNEANAQVNAGTLQQTTQQAQDTAAYNQFLQQQAYPFQTTGWLANIVEGIGSQSGGTSTGQSQTDTSNSSAILGGLVGLGSFLAKGGRVNSEWPRKAGGGGLVPYSDIYDPSGANEPLGGGSVVPTTQLQIGHTMPTGSGAGASPGASAGQPGQNMAGIAKGVQGLGSAFSNSSLGDSVGDALQDIELGGFAKGGLVNPRRGYDDGGAVSPADALWAASDPQGTGTLIDPTAGTLAPQSSAPPTSPAALEQLGAAMGGLGIVPANSNTGPNLAYGDIAQDQYSASPPTPPIRPVDFSADAVPTPPVRPAGLGVSPSTAGLAPPAPLVGAGLASADANASPGSDAIGGLNPNARGMKNNNPGNLESNSWTQSLPGYVGSDGRFAIFSTPQDGISALDRNLQGYGNRGISTPLQIASTWAPGSEKGNNPASYGSVIAKTLGVGVNDPVDMSDPNTRSKIGHAIAFVENGPGNGSLASAPAAQAIAASAAPPGLVGRSASPSASGLASGAAYAPLTADSPVASSDASPSASLNSGPGIFGENGGGHAGLLGLHFSDAQRQGTLAAGLGMMGGTSINPFVNIGQGGLQGINAYNNARQLEGKLGLNNAKTLHELTQTQGEGIENKIKQQQLSVMMDILGKHEDVGNQKADAIAASTSGKNVTSPTVTAPTVAPTKIVDPAYDPDRLNADASRMAMVPSFSEAAKIKKDQAAAILSGNQMVHFTDGSVGYYPGTSAAKAAQAQQVAEGQESAKVPAAVAQKVAEAGLAAKTQAYSDAEVGQTTLSQAQALRDSMFDPKTGAANVNSGPLGPTIAKTAAIMDQAGVAPSLVKFLTGTDPNDAQIGEKFRTALGSETARQDLGTVRQTEFLRYLQSTPSNEILPKAFQFLIDKAIVPKAQQQIGAYQTIADMDPAKANIQKELMTYRSSHPWYTPGQTVPAGAAQGQTGTPTAAPAVTPEMAKAELARRAAARGQPGASP